MTVLLILERVRSLDQNEHEALQPPSDTEAQIGGSAGLFPFETNRLDR